jgi:hypothetical protein
MRRGGTVLVVVVVAAIALAAGFDALRGDSEPEQAPDPTTGTEPPTTSTTEAPAGSPELGGVLYYTDEGCELHAVELPERTPVDAPNWDECRFVLSPDANRVSGAGSGWDRHTDPRRGRLFEFEDGLIQVSTNGGPEGEPFRGQAPAWRPDGTLTYFADGAVRTWPDGDVVLSQRGLIRALRHSSVPGLAGFERVRVREAVWLDERRLAAILSVDGPSGSWDVLTSFGNGGLSEAFVETPGRFADLRASPTGTYIAARRGQDGVIMAQPGSGELDMPEIAGYRAIAWSPDEQWTAVAADRGIFILRPGSSEWTARINLVANDLDWRGEGGPPPLVDADEVRDWLGRVGGTGRLFVSVPGCRLRALRLPDLAWDEEPDVPAPCRFTLTPNDAPLDEAFSVSPDGELRATCEGGSLRVFQSGGFRTALPDACGPSWMGDGTLTFVRNGELWEGIEDARRLFSRERVSELLGRPSTLEEIAWFDDQRFWAVVRSGETAIVALLSTTDDLVFSPSFTAREITGLRVSATGMVAARTDQGIVFFDSGGRRALTFPNGRAVAWAPGELIAAVATPSEVLFVAPVSREVVSLPLAVRDLEWVVP